MIYIITDGEFYKIGRSKLPYKRLKQLQTGNRKPLRLIHIFEYQQKGRITEEIAEKRIHYLLRQFRKKGEWFRFENEQDLIDIITTILSHI